MNLSLKCKDCQFFCNGRHPQQGKPCTDLGYKSFAKACSLYQPLTINMLENLDVLKAMAKVARKMNVGDTRILSWLINNIPTLHQNGYEFGQTLYVNLSSPYIDYANCWYKANLVNIIVMKDLDGESSIYLQMVANIRGEEQTLLTFPPSIVLTKTEFLAHKAKLVEKGLVEIPQPKQKSDIQFKLNQPLNKPYSLISADEVPTIDTVPAFWLDSRRILDWVDPIEPKKKKKKVVKPDSVTEQDEKTSGKKDNYVISFGKHE